ncbi:MAG TPA: hypothetical protein VKA21_15700 [Candidatus Binatia bacterium]|nr:hypothetical protein [Candidatus Binatia bacterium]
MAGRSWAFTRGLDHAAASWPGTRHLAFLDARQQRVLAHCRAFSYVHLLGNYEDFILVHVESMAADADRRLAEGLGRFGEEERKHEHLFRRAETTLEASCGHAFERYFDAERSRVTALTDAILGYPSLPRFLILLALEWGTQQHFVESVRERSDPLYADVLRAHWVEEAQHTKWDTLAVARLAADADVEELTAAFDDVLAIGALVDATFAGQAEAEVRTLERITGRALSESEAIALRDALHRSLAASIAGLALTHPASAKVALELTPRGAAKLGISAG